MHNFENFLYFTKLTFQEIADFYFMRHECDNTQDDIAFTITIFFLLQHQWVFFRN